MPEIGNKMLKADIDLIDETFDISQSENYYLSVLISQDELSFCVCNSIINKYVFLRNYPISNKNNPLSEYQSIFERDDILGLRYKSCKNMLVSPRFTLVPDYLFDDDSKELYMTFNHGEATDNQTLQNHVKSTSLYNVFSYPNDLTDLLNTYQPNIKLFHHATTFLNTIVSRYSTALAVRFYSGYLDIVFIENGKLLFYNTFLIDAPEDAVYYLLVVSNLFDIDLKTQKLIYAGNYEQMPTEIAILNNYVESIVECEPSKTVYYSYHISEIFRKRFINLFNLYECE